MAVLIDWVISAAARHIGDPNRKRIQTPQWNEIATLALNDICMKYNALKYEDEFDLPSDGLLTYPESLVSIHEIKVSSTPTVETSFQKIDEKFRDEWDIIMLRGLPAAEVPLVYMADKDYIRLGATLTADIVDGGRISYFAIPDPVIDATTTYMPLPDLLKSYFMQRMVVYALFADERDQLAREEEQLWNAREDEIRSKIDHRTVDRRESMRAASGQRKYRGMA